MTESIDDLSNASPEVLEKLFEKITMLSLKAHRKTLLDHDDRIQELEAKIKALEQGGK